MSKWHYLSIIGLSIVLALLLRHIPQSLLEGPSAIERNVSQQYPETYLINAKITQYNEQGNVSNTLTADHMRYFEKINIRLFEDYIKHTLNTPPSNVNIVLLDNPVITFYGNENELEAPWIASSINGHSQNNGNEVTLNGNVVLTQKINQQQFTTIESESLFIKPNEQYAETNQAVTIKDQSGVTTSKGFKISLERGTLEFLSHVRSQYHAQ